MPKIIDNNLTPSTLIRRTTTLCDALQPNERSNALTIEHNNRWYTYICHKIFRFEINIQQNTK